MLRCDLGRDVFKNKLIAQTAFDKKEQCGIENLFCQGNGYMGVRANLEEQCESGKAGIYVSGFYNDSKKLFNIADVFALRFKINGKELLIEDKNVSDFMRVLNLLDGELQQSFLYTDEQCTLQCTLSRFVSLKNEHIAASQFKMQVIAGSASIDFSSGININEKAAYYACVFDKNILQLSYIINNKSAVVSSGSRFYLNSIQIKPDTNIRKTDAGIAEKARFNLKENDCLVIEKFSSINTSADLDYRDVNNFNVEKDSLASMRETLGIRYNKHLAASRKAWDAYYKDNGILISSEKDTDETALNFALYHMRTISHPLDDRQIVGRFGLSDSRGEENSEYTEMRLSPYYLLCRSTQARPREKIYGQYEKLQKARQQKDISLSDKCIALYREGDIDSAQKMLDEVIHKVFDTEKSVETADVCGVWSCFTEGIAGISLQNSLINIAPAHQQRVNILQVPVWTDGRQLLIRLEKDHFFVIVSGKSDAHLKIYGKEICLSNGIHRFATRGSL